MKCETPYTLIQKWIKIANLSRTKNKKKYEESLGNRIDWSEQHRNMPHKNI